MNLALIGVGRMGTPIAERLRSAGHRLRLHDVAAAEGLAAAGFEVAPSPQAAARDADLVLLCLPDAAAVQDVAGRLPREAFVVDLTSSLPSVTRSLPFRRLLDAPLSGGVAGARAGTLTVMAGGEERLLEEARPVLEAFSGRIFHAGPPGAGHCVKALNNALSAVALSATSEAVAVGRYAGHGPEGVVKRLNVGLGRTQNSEVKFPRDVLTGRYASGFTAGLMLKDVSTALEVARGRGVGTPLVSLVRELWSLVVSQIGADGDFTRVYEVVSAWRRTGSHPLKAKLCDLDHFDRAVAAACMIGAQEMTAVAEAEGVARQTFLEIVNEGSGRSEATRHFDRGLGFARERAVRSLDAVRELASGAGHAVPVLAAAAEQLRSGAAPWR